MRQERRVAAILEVLGVYLAGQLVTGLLIRLLGGSPPNPLDNLTVHITNAELISATRQMFVLLMLQYAGYFLLIIPINWWYRRRGAAAYGLTRAGRSWTMLLLAGLATLALTEAPGLIVTSLNAIHPLGKTVPWRQAFFDMSWRRWQFWLFSAVLSWALIPVVEELFFRGYCQRRLAEDWGDGPAIIGTACLFTFAHTQYQTLNAYNVGTIISLLVFAIGFGVVFAWTRSLIPAIVAHSVIDIPMTPLWSGVILTAVFVIGVSLSWRRGLAVVKQVFSKASVVWYVALAIIGTGYAIAAARMESLEYVAAGMVVLAVGLEAMDRWRNRMLTEPSISR